MRLSEMIRKRAPRAVRDYVRLSKNEERVFETIIRMHNGNAYNVWKSSGLKHYPTVFRILKKLQERRLVQVIAENGIRHERIYSPTILGTLLFYALKDETRKLVETISQESKLFKEALESRAIDESWGASICYNMMQGVIEGESRSIDGILKKTLEEMIQGRLINLWAPEAERLKNEILDFTKSEWIRRLALESLETELSSAERLIEELKELKETLMIKQ